MAKGTKKPAVEKETKKVSTKKEKIAKNLTNEPKAEKETKAANVSAGNKEQTLQELKKAADKSFKKKYSNKRKVVGLTLGALGLAAIGTVTPIVVLNSNREISISVQSVNATADKYKVKVKKGTKIKDIKIVELEGYEFLGYFKDEACTKPYKLTEELKKNATIYASYVQKRYYVSIEGDTEHYNVSANATLNHGESYTLIISPKAGFYIEGLIVKVNGEEVTLTNGSYTIPNITADVSVELIEHTYSVNVTGDVENYEVSNNATIIYGQPYTLTITPKTGYFLEGVTVKVNNQEVTLNNGSYTISNVTANTTIELIEKTHTVTIVGDTGHYNVSSNATIVYGQPYTLNVIAKEGFDVSFLTVKVNNQEVTLTNGSYTIPNVTEDTTVELIANNQVLTVKIGNSDKQIGFMPNTTIKNVVELIDTLEYETSGTVYSDEACTQEADLNASMTANTTLYTKAATLDKLSFTWDATTSCWSVKGKSCWGSDDVVIPASYKDNIHDGSVKIIENYAFEGGGFTSIIIPNSVTTIGECAFYQANLRTITISNSVTTIGDYAFSQCALESLTIENGVTTIGKGAFDTCYALTSVTIPNSVTSISDSMFYDCYALTSVTIPNSVTTIGSGAFSVCTNLTTITIPNSVTTIGESAFSQCYKLTTITIPSSVTTIGEWALYDVRTAIIDSSMIANSLIFYESNGHIIYNATTVYIKEGLDTSSSTYLTSNFTKQATSDKDGYDKWVKNS